MIEYKNSFYHPMLRGSEKTIKTNAKPVKYRGMLIYHRIVSRNKSANCFDIVKDGVCVGMCAGIDGAKVKIHTLISVQHLRNLKDALA